MPPLVNTFKRVDPLAERLNLTIASSVHTLNVLGVNETDEKYGFGDTGGVTSFTTWNEPFGDCVVKAPVVTS